jgi:hypothetical protein
MEKQNITLTLPKDLLNQIKHIAIDKNTSVTGLLTQTLEDIVQKNHSYHKAKIRQLTLMEKGFTMGTMDKSSWSREELHERS